MWGFIYVGAFIVAFVASAIIKMTYSPLSGEMQVNWNDSVGRVYTDTGLPTVWIRIQRQAYSALCLVTLLPQI
ncbi:hypothetical protein PAECIP111890_00545 [Paenibacillus sp. JJ-223]|nr:hypothetical protein PAECIP111890_00545 [Paenibacillus sp. JJ-223]